MVVCRYLGRACVEIVSDNEHFVIDPNYVEVPRKGVNMILLTHEHDDHFSPDKIMKIRENYAKDNQELKIFAPNSIKNEVGNLKPSKVEDESIIELNDGRIKVYSIDCWKSEACVAYLIEIDNKRILHTADSANYSERLRSIEKGVDCCFVATFEDYYDDYLRFIKEIEPNLTVPYHFGPDKNQMGKNTAKFLKDHGVNVKYLDPGEEIEL